MITNKRVIYHFIDNSRLFFTSTEFDFIFYNDLESIIINPLFMNDEKYNQVEFYSSKISRINYNKERITEKEYKKDGIIFHAVDDWKYFLKVIQDIDPKIEQIITININ